MLGVCLIVSYRSGTVQINAACLFIAVNNLWQYLDGIHIDVSTASSVFEDHRVKASRVEWTGVSALKMPGAIGVDGGDLDAIHPDFDVAAVGVDTVSEDEPFPAEGEGSTVSYGAGVMHRVIVERLTSRPGFPGAGIGPGRVCVIVDTCPRCCGGKDLDGVDIDVSTASSVFEDHCVKAG